MIIDGAVVPARVLTMHDTSHLCAITERLSRERARLAQARSATERALRAEWVRQAERELAAEYAHLGMSPVEGEMSDDDLLAELM